MTLSTAAGEAEKCRAEAAEFKGMERRLLLKIADAFERLEVAKIVQAGPRGGREEVATSVQVYPTQ